MSPFELALPPLHPLAWPFAPLTLTLKRLWAVAFGEAREDLEALEDPALLELVRRGGARGDAAYAVVVRRHQGWMLHFLGGLLQQHSGDVEDVAQETFVGAYLALNTWRGEASFRTWLRTIAMRTAFNWQRGRKTASRYEAMAMSTRSTSTGPQQDDTIEREALNALLQELPYPYREILILRHLEEMSIEEISQSLNIGASAAKMRLKRAREQLKAAHGEMMGDEEAR